MFKERLDKILKKHSLTTREAEKKTGISSVYFSYMRNGKRPVTEKSWLKILTNIEGLTIKKAREQIALWKIEEAEKELGKPRKMVLSQNKKPYLIWKDIANYFRSNGLNDDEIDVIQKQFKIFKNKK